MLIPGGILTLGAPNPLFDACKTLIKRGGFAMGHQNMMGFIDKTSFYHFLGAGGEGKTRIRSANIVQGNIF